MDSTFLWANHKKNQCEHFTIYSSIVIFSVGINNKDQDPRQTTIKQLKTLFRTAKLTFPNADIYFPNNDRWTCGQRKRAEKIWIHRLGTTVPGGLNDD
ncbi:hypothetical protein GBF38_000026 [Scomber scombrus]|uniref:Uncharacterized protein n=1 Tax=Scomber scombrus TaxID=13677 RepID=A0AAV1MWZ7_SCOSC